MQEIVTYHPVSTSDTDIVVTTNETEAEISATSLSKAFSTTTILKFDMKEIGNLALDALSLSEKTLGPITQEAKETTKKVMQSLQPLVEPVYQKICKRIKEWSKHCDFIGNGPFSFWICTRSSSLARGYSGSFIRQKETTIVH